MSALDAFSDVVAVYLGYRPPDAVVAAALASVRVRRKQATAKLSPVWTPPRASSRRPGPRPVAPYCASTYATFASCPGSCVFLRDGRTGERRGCFVDGNVNADRTMRVLDAAAAEVGPVDRHALLALAEAFAVDRTFPSGVPQDGARGGRDLRLHVAGDAVTAAAARILGDSATRWTARGGGRVWSFTHAWPVVPRESWGPVSVLASVETPEAVRSAMNLGYAAAVVVERFPGARAFTLEGVPEVRVIPCPAELGVRGTTCVTCRLCLDDVSLRSRQAAIAFEAHGTYSRAASASVRAVREIGGRMRRALPVL